TGQRLLRHQGELGISQVVILFSAHQSGSLSLALSQHALPEGELLDSGRDKVDRSVQLARLLPVS
ncbi:hypothetical protein SB780_34230, partial [Burkholderia sp. SIMBA_057]